MVTVQARAAASNVYVKVFVHAAESTASWLVIAYEQQPSLFASVVVVEETTVTPSVCIIETVKSQVSTEVGTAASAAVKT